MEQEQVAEKEEAVEVEVADPSIKEQKEQEVEVEVPTEEKAEAEPEKKEDELENYSKNVQARIKKLTEKYRKEERDREEAVRMSQRLLEENKQLKQQVLQYKQAMGELKETLVETNLSNGRLLYTNRVLRNTSLNERQKTRIVEAISNAGSVTEAKTIYDTLQSTVQATPKRSPKSLSEAIGRRSSVIRATRQESTAVDPISDRMQKLAGIK